MLEGGEGLDALEGKSFMHSYTPLCFCSSGDSTARLWRLREDRSHDPPVVLPHEPVGSGTQKCNRDVTTVHWNVRVWREGGGRRSEEGERGGFILDFDT